VPTCTIPHDFYRPDAFLPPNQQCQSTEGNKIAPKYAKPNFFRGYAWNPAERAYSASQTPSYWTGGLLESASRLLIYATLTTGCSSGMSDKRLFHKAYLHALKS